jgi:hypothetical protein
MSIFLPAYESRVQPCPTKGAKVAKTHILYHHTDPVYLPSILEVGLLARPWGGGNDPALSAILHHRSVVWLTTQPSTLLTKADTAFLREQGREDEAAPGVWLPRNGGNLLSLKIDIPKHSKKLSHYQTWVKKNEAVIVNKDGVGRRNDEGELWTTASHLEGCLPSMAHWYIYFGDISPKRIEAA